MSDDARQNAEYRLVVLTIRLDWNIQTVREALNERAYVVAIRHPNDGPAFGAMNRQHLEIAVLRRD